MPRLRLALHSCPNAQYLHGGLRIAHWDNSDVTMAAPRRMYHRPGTLRVPRHVNHYRPDRIALPAAPEPDRCSPTGAQAFLTLLADPEMRVPLSAPGFRM